MPNPITPRKVVKPAEPGQVSGYGRLIRRDTVDPDYAEAAKLAYGRPGHPIIVHEFDIPQDPDGTAPIQTLERQKDLDKYVQAELRVALKLLNEADAAKELPLPDGFTLLTVPPGLQRFQVSMSTSTEEKVVRTYVVFHPNGRQVRRRRRADEATAGTEQGELAVGEPDPAPGEDEEPF